MEHQTVTGADDGTQAAGEKQVVGRTIVEGRKKIGVFITWVTFVANMTEQRTLIAEAQNSSRKEE